jgi:hypothetical protein
MVYSLSFKLQPLPLLLSLLTSSNGYTSSTPLVQMSLKLKEIGSGIAEWFTSSLRIAGRVCSNPVKGKALFP